MIWSLKIDLCKYYISLYENPIKKIQFELLPKGNCLKGCIIIYRVSLKTSLNDFFKRLNKIIPNCF